MIIFKSEKKCLHLFVFALRLCNKEIASDFEQPSKFVQLTSS